MRHPAAGGVSAGPPGERHEYSWVYTSESLWLVTATNQTSRNKASGWFVTATDQTSRNKASGWLGSPLRLTHSTL
eukprot:453366-Pyramimonas_sp.AAC.2